MSTTQQDQTIDKPRQRGRKAGKRGAKAETPREEQPMDAAFASADVVASAAAEAEQSPAAGLEPVAIDEAVEASVLPAGAPAPEGDSAPVNMQTIANAYRDYTRKSIQANRSFVEQLMGVRSLDKAVEVQTDFARQAYVNFVAESQKICGLYSELAGQALKRGRR